MNFRRVEMINWSKLEQIWWKGKLWQGFHFTFNLYRNRIELKNCLRSQETTKYPLRANKLASKEQTAVAPRKSFGTNLRWQTNATKNHDLKKSKLLTLLSSSIRHLKKREKRHVKCARNIERNTTLTIYGRCEKFAPQFFRSLNKRWNPSKPK